MTASNKGDRTTQLAIAVIMAIIGPIIVYYFTVGRNSGNEQALEATAGALEAKRAAQQATTEALEAQSEQQAYSSGSDQGNSDTPPTPIGIRNPTGSVDGGIPIIVDEFSLYVDSNSISVDSDLIYVSILVKNIGSRKRIFRFVPNSVRIQDDRGNTYVHFVEGYGEGSEGYGEPSNLYNVVKQVEIGSGDEVKIESDYRYWCSEFFEKDIAAYIGPISPQANAIYFIFDGFGPFTGFQVKVPL